MEKLSIQETASASVTRGAGLTEEAGVHGKFVVECYGSDGKLKWADEAKNLVTDEGKMYLLNMAFLDAGNGDTMGTWYIGLKKTTAGGAAADTLATHAGWTEAVPGTDYTGTRQGPIMWDLPTGTGTVYITHATAAQFTASGTWTAYGCILTTAPTGTAGMLYSVSADFAAPKALTTGDILNVTYRTQV